MNNPENKENQQGMKELEIPEEQEENISGGVLPPLEPEKSIEVMHPVLKARF